jgi:hypothetical protein
MRGFLGFERKPVDRFEDVEPDIQAGPDYSSLYRALPFDSAPTTLIGVDASTVDPLAGIASPAQPIIPTQDVFNDLDTLRLKMPWLPIVLFPPLIRSAFMAVANTPTDINVPTGAAIVQFYGPGDFYVSLGGRAVVPSAATEVDASTLYKPTGAFYIGATKQISVVSPNANGIVQAAFWSK